ncbi:MAG: hypothetical protein N3A54_00035 [Patescibacteria group bacterium]|nr:hypothetical protein [Patescibacteria group bacterium]
MIGLIEYNRKDFYNKYKFLIDKIGKPSFVDFFDWMEKTYKNLGGRPKFFIFNKLIMVFNNENETKSLSLDKFRKILEENEILNSLVNYENLLERPRLIKDYHTYAVVEDSDAYPELLFKTVDDFIDEFNKINNLHDLIEFSKTIKSAYKILINWDEMARKSVLVEDNEEAKIYEIKSYYHAVSLAKGTNWCTSKIDDYKKYSESLDMYVIIPKQEKKVYGDDNTVYELKYQLSLLKKEFVFLINEYINVFHKVTDENMFNQIFNGVLLFSLFDLYPAIKNAYSFLEEHISYFDKTNLDNIIRDFFSYFEKNEERLNMMEGPIDISEYIKHLFDDFYKNSSKTSKIYNVFTTLSNDLPLKKESLFSFLHKIKSEIDDSKRLSVSEFIFNNKEYIKLFNKVEVLMLSRLKPFIQELESKGFFEIIECSDNNNNPVEYENMFKYIKNEKFRRRLESTIELNERYYSNNIDSVQDLEDSIWDLRAKFLERKYEQIKNDPIFHEMEKYVNFIIDSLNLIYSMQDEIGRVLLDSSQAYFEVLKDFFEKKKGIIKVKFYPSSLPAKNELIRIINI